MIVFDIIGLIAFAISGVLISIYKKLDIFGVFFISTLTALGGGVLRDTIANKAPFSFTNYYPITVVFMTIIIALYFKSHIKDIDRKFLFVLFDSIGLCAFSITGALVGVEVGYNLFGVISLAISTAVGGGLIRDMLLNKVPFILKKEVYATISIMIAIFIFLFDKVGLNNNFSMMILMLIMIGIRLYSYRRDYHLPRV